ncbi:MAG TPA: hypothetical protein VFC21_10260 [Bryobacteraceae bacterium]|nr:hypothetical protein [Bryobacteraceae bacterium]
MSDNVVHVPRPPAKSFNSNRPLSGNTLLRHQVDHFREVEKTLPPELQTGFDHAAITTEGAAGEYIRRITAVLHPAGARKEKVRKAV